jgi:hypothetical protein
MEISSLVSTARRIYRLGMQAAALPVVHLNFDPQSDPAPMREAYRHYTRRHPRYKLVRHRSMATALVDLSAFGSPYAYLETVLDRGHAGQQAIKAKAHGFAFSAIDAADYRDEIARIRQAPEERQCRLTDPSWSIPAFGEHAHHRHFGAFNRHGELTAYCKVGIYGNFAATEELIGYKNRDGAIYLVLSGVICRLIDETALDYFMYESFLDIAAGLRKLKRKCGFRPYFVRYSLASEAAAQSVQGRLRGSR